MTIKLIKVPVIIVLTTALTLLFVSCASKQKGDTNTSISEKSSFESTADTSATSEQSETADAVSTSKQQLADDENINVISGGQYGEAPAPAAQPSENQADNTVTVPSEQIQESQPTEKVETAPNTQTVPKEETVPETTVQEPSKPTVKEEPPEQETKPTQNQSSEATVKDGVVTKGVLQNSPSMDFRENPYLVDFMKNNFAAGTYIIEAGGVTYSSTHTDIKTSTYATIFSAPDFAYNCWNIHVQKFGDSEKSVMKAILKTLTADAVYAKFAEMGNAEGTLDEIKAKYKFDTWQTVGSTQYMFSKTTQYIVLRIK